MGLIDDDSAKLLSEEMKSSLPENSWFINSSLHSNATVFEFGLYRFGGPDKQNAFLKKRVSSGI